MASRPTSSHRLHLLSLDGAPLTAPPEWRPAWVVVDVPPEQWETVRLWRNDQEVPLQLRHLAGHRRVLAEWPPPTDSTLAQELVRLRRAVEGGRGRPGLTEILPAIGRDPYHVLTSITPWVMRQSARRPHPTGIAQALGRQHNLDDQDRLKRVLDLRVDHTVDVYENRLVKVYVHQVELRLRRLILALEGTAATSAVYADACALQRKLTTAQRQAVVLEEVTLPAHLPDHVTMALAKRPAYRAALEGYLEFRRSVSVRLEDPAVDAPLENLPYLYQLWCTLEVIEALLAIAPTQGYAVQTQQLVGTDASGLYVRVLRDGKPALILRHPDSGTTLRFIPERTYGTGTGLHSVSYPQRPDMAIEVWSSSRPLRIYLLDPKYRLDSDLGVESDSKPTKLDIDKMHAYRDAIRDGEDRRIVTFAGIMYHGS